MKQGSTLFLKVVIYLIGLVVLGLCVVFVGNIIGGEGHGGMYLPILLSLLLTAIPFFYALYQGLNLLSYIDKNIAFSESSVQALKTAKYCHGLVCVLYALMMPYVIYVAEKDDAPGAVAIALVIMFGFFVTCVFTAVVEKLVQNALDIKSENDLTV
jgi:hypothetical protein